MSVACQSWEVASGPTVGFTVAIQSTICAAASDTLSSETGNYCSHTALSHDSLMKAVVAGTDVSKGLIFPSPKVLSPQDTLTRGLSSLSLHPQSPLLTRNPSEHTKALPFYELSNKILERKCDIPSLSNGTNFCSSTACLADDRTYGKVSGAQKILYHDGSNSKGFEDVSCCVSASPSHSGSSDIPGSNSPNSFRVPTRNHIPWPDKYGEYECYGFPRRTLDAVVEDKPYEEIFTGNDELEDDALSASSSNSACFLLDLPVDGAVSVGEEFGGAEESEAQGLSTLAGGSSPRRKGLSRFYAGKSRSYSCLSDAMSVKDLAKPENPYAKKRRCITGSGMNTGRSQPGSDSLSKERLHDEKSTTALDASMSAVEDRVKSEGNHRRLGAQKRSFTSRTYSLCDLQRVSSY